MLSTKYRWQNRYSTTMGRMSRTMPAYLIRVIAIGSVSYTHLVDPDSPDYLNFATGGQRLVDAAFLAHALLRAPHALWEELPLSLIHISGIQVIRQ